jgi:hypothetical protein
MGDQDTAGNIVTVTVEENAGRLETTSTSCYEAGKPHENYMVQWN